MILKFGVIREYLPLLLKGCVATVQVSVLAGALALSLGLTVALVRVAPVRMLRLGAGGYIHLIRGIPVLVQIYFTYFGLPAVGLRFSPIMAGVLALGINSSAYVAEVLRAGIEAIERGQVEASRALGLTFLQTMRRIVLPQIVVFLLPPLTNEFVILLKASSLTSIITVSELTWMGQIATGESFAPVEIYLSVAALYLCMNLVLLYGARWMERRRGVYL